MPGFKLSAQLRQYMEQNGDVALFYQCVARQLLPPARTATHSSGNSVPLSGSTSRAADASRTLTDVFSCIKGTMCTEWLPAPADCVLLVSNRSAYFLPHERVALCDVLDVICHCHCQAAQPILELRMRDARCDSKTDSEVRMFSLESEYALRQAAAVFTSAAPNSRMLMHSLEWLLPPSRMEAKPHDDYDAETHRATRLLRDDDDDENRLQQRLATYKRQKAMGKRMLPPRGVSSLAAFGPGHFGQAAEVLGDELNEMLTEMDKLIQSCGAPEPIRAADGGSVPHASSIAR